LGSLDNSETKRLIPGDSAGEYVEPGWLLFNRQGALVARRLNLAHAALEGDPLTLADSVSYDTAFNLGGFSVSPAGNVAYRAGALERRQLKWFDRTGRVLSEVGEPEVNLQQVALSPDGRRAAVNLALRAIQTSGWSIWHAALPPDPRSIPPQIIGEVGLQMESKSRSSRIGRASTTFI
jgi:hypothetical protein